RGGFIRTAIHGKAPIIPVSIVGAEEIHPNLLRLDFLGKPLGLPYFPITPTFPLLGPLGVIPLPSKWMIKFCEPIPMDSYTAQDALDFLTVSKLTETVRENIQDGIKELLVKRKRAFF
ncbi:MAG: glycerol acyltransferase, partial [Planctomycetota bacterium]